MSLVRRPVEWLRGVWSGPFSLKLPPQDGNFYKRLGSDGPAGAAGVVVDHATAFTCSAVYDAVNQISSDTAKLPCSLLKRRPDGGSDQYVDSRTYDLIKVEPNPEMDAMVFRRTLTAHALTWHGGFAEIERDGLGRPVYLWPLEPHRVTLDRLDGRLIYRVAREHGGEDPLLAEDVLHIRGLGYSAEQGYSLIHKARAAIGLALAAEKFGASFFGNGSSFGGILNLPQGLNLNDEERINGIRTSITKRHQGPENAHKFLLLEHDMQYTRTGIDPQAAQMDALRSKQIEEVARFFNMPVHKLKNLDRATNNNIEQQDLEYYKGCLLTWITLWEMELNRKLIPRLERRQQYFKHNANAFLRGDAASRAAFYSALLDRGVYNADMVLELEDLNPQPNGQGKLFLVQGAMVPKDKLNELAQAQIDAVTAKASAPTAPTDAAVAEAEERAARAASAAAEARADAEQLRGELATAREAGTASAATADVLTARVAAAETLALNLTTVAETMRADVTRLAAEATELREALAAALAEREATLNAATARAEAAERQVQDAAEALRVATTDLASTRQAVETIRAERRAADEALAGAAAERDRLQGELTRSDAERQAATAAADETRMSAERMLEEARSLQTVADALKAQSDAATADREALAAQVTTAQAEADAARAAAADASAERLRLEGEARSAEARAREAATALEAATGEAVTRRAEAGRVSAALTVAEEARQAAEAGRVDAEQRAALAEQARAAAHAQASEAQAALKSAQQAAKEAETVRNQDEDTRSSAVLAAHRTLAAHTMRLMVERETERARRAQGSTEKLRAWMTSWYDGHEALMVEALTPVLSVHLAWIGSTRSVLDVAREYAAGHIAESKRQLAAVIDGDAGALAGSLAHLLQRWEVERPDTFAADLMQKEIAYVRRGAA